MYFRRYCILSGQKTNMNETHGVSLEHILYTLLCHFALHLSFVICDQLSRFEGNILLFIITIQFSFFACSWLVLCLTYPIRNHLDMLVCAISFQPRNKMMEIHSLQMRYGMFTHSKSCAQANPSSVFVVIAHRTHINIQFRETLRPAGCMVQKQT